MSEKVSVLMPVKNVDNYFNLSFNSIVNQTYNNIEIIIIVDESQVCDIKSVVKKSEREIKIVGSNMLGISCALNAGIQKSDGVYIARMDADDISDLTRIEKQINYFNKNLDCKILGTQAKYINESGKSIGSSKNINININILKEMCYGNILIHPTVMMNARFIKKLGGYSNTSSEDYELWLRALEVDEKSICIMGEELLAYRIHENQVSKVTRVKSQAAVCAAIYSALIRNFSINLFGGLIFNMTKLCVRKLIK